LASIVTLLADSFFGICDTRDSHSLGLLFDSRFRAPMNQSPKNGTSPTKVGGGGMEDSAAAAEGFGGGGFGGFGGGGSGGGG